MRDRAAAAPDRACLLLPATALGLVVERSSGSWPDARLWLPDLAVGVVVAAAALLASYRQRAVAALLGATAVSWFLGTLWAPALFLHVGFLVHLLVAAPGWRLRSRAAATAVAAGYVVAVTMPGWQSEAGVVLVAVGLVAVLAVERLRAKGAARPLRSLALRAGSGLALILLAGAALRTAVPEGRAVAAALLLHQLAVCAVAVAMATGLRRPPVELVTDLVVELGEEQSGSLRDALARALGDPGLELGHLTSLGTYVDADGRPLVLPTPGGARTATYVERDGRPFAVLVHDAVVLDEPALVLAVASATRLSASHTSLSQEVGARMTQLEAVRRRLLLAGDEEQQRLEQRVHGGAERRLKALSDLLNTAACAPDPGGHVLLARQELGHTLDGVRALAQGLHPRELDQGLRPALEALAGRSPLPVTVDVDDLRVDPEVDAGAWFVCAEALANAVKHAGATGVTITARRTGDTLLLVVSDDGVGGAQPGRGTGLAGLADRVDALGGRLRVRSPAGGGTTVTAELPLDRSCA